MAKRAGAPRKDGLDYFRMKTNFFETDTVQAAKYEFGPFGPLIYMAILCTVYANGSYAKMSRDQLSLAVKAKIGYNPMARGGGRNRKNDIVDQVIGYLAQEGVLDEESLSGGVVTSAEIQSDHLEMSRAAKRCLHAENYWLLGTPSKSADEEAVINAPEKGISSEEIPISSEEITVSTGNNPTKKSKVKNIKPYIYPQLRARKPFFDNFMLNAAFLDYVKAREERHGPISMDTVEILAEQLEEIAGNDKDRILICKTATANRWKNFYPKKAASSAGSGQRKNAVGSFGNYEQRNFDYRGVEKAMRGYQNVEEG